MSRKYMNDRWCVRCGRQTATPFLAKNWEKICPEDPDFSKIKAVDIGCGNGRNMKFLEERGVRHVTGLDMAGDFGKKCVLGSDKMPVPRASADIILANYVFMFLDKQELWQTLKEIKRIAKSGCNLVVEFYAALDSHCPNDDAIQAYKRHVIDYLDWVPVKVNKEKMILKKP